MDHPGPANVSYIYHTRLAGRTPASHPCRETHAASLQCPAYALSPCSTGMSPAPGGVCMGAQVERGVCLHADIACRLRPQQVMTLFKGCLRPGICTDTHETTANRALCGRGIISLIFIMILLKYGLFPEEGQRMWSCVVQDANLTPYRVCEWRLYQGNTKGEIP